MTAELTVVAYGEPIGQGRVTTYGPGRTTHSNKARLIPWRDNVRAATIIAMGDDPTYPWEGPVSLTCAFIVAKPKSAPKTRPTWPSKRPDLSHLVRAVEDALVDAGAIHDDAQITFLEASKDYPGARLAALERPGVLIRLESP